MVGGEQLAATRKLSMTAWREMAAQLADVITEDATLDEYISALEPTGESNRVALFDRNLLDGDWRPVVLELQERGDGVETSMWKLLDADGVTILDEADDGCPASGFSEKSLIDDVIAGFYRVATKEDCEGMAVGERDDDEATAAADAAAAAAAAADAADAADADADANSIDLDMMRVSYEGQTGTLRTRAGSKDSCIPATKVLFLTDQGQGKHSLLKTDIVSSLVTPVEDDPLPPGRHPVKLMRGSPASKVEGTFLGELTNAPFTTVPEHHTDLEVFAGVHYLGREDALLSGQNVYSPFCVSDKRPRNEFYFVALLKATVKRQTRYNALVFCAEDNKIEQLGLVHVRQAASPVSATQPILDRMHTAASEYVLKNFVTSYNASLKAEAPLKGAKAKPMASKPTTSKPTTNAASRPTTAAASGHKRPRAQLTRTRPAAEPRADPPAASVADDGHAELLTLRREMQAMREQVARASQPHDEPPPTTSNQGVIASLAHLPSILERIEERLLALEGRPEKQDERAPERTVGTTATTETPTDAPTFLPSTSRIERRTEPLRFEAASLFASIREDERAKRERLSALQMLM